MISFVSDDENDGSEDSRDGAAPANGEKLVVVLQTFPRAAEHNNVLTTNSTGLQVIVGDAWLRLAMANDGLKLRFSSKLSSGR